MELPQSCVNDQSVFISFFFYFFYPSVLRLKGIVIACVRPDLHHVVGLFILRDVRLSVHMAKLVNVITLEIFSKSF